MHHHQLRQRTLVLAADLGGPGDFGRPGTHLADFGSGVVVGWAAGAAAARARPAATCT